MFQHIIITGWDFTKGVRAGFHISYKKEPAFFQQESLVNIKKFIEDSKLDISVHKVETDSSSLESVQSSDHYFVGIEFISDSVDFIERLSNTQQISALDVSEYIISRLENCSPLKLQKLLYLSYKDYLNKSKKKLFKEDLKAWEYGPVVQEVYAAYKHFGRGSIKLSKSYKDEQNITDGKELSVPKSLITARFIAIKDGIEMISSIDKVIAAHGNKTAKELVDITHEKGSPWEIVYSKKPGYGIIDPETILNGKKLN